MGSPHDGKVFLNPTHQFRPQLLLSDEVDHSIDAFLEMNVGIGLVGEDGRNVTQAVTEQQKTHAERTTSDELFTRRVGVNVSIPEHDFVVKILYLIRQKISNFII